MTMTHVVVSWFLTNIDFEQVTCSESRAVSIAIRALLHVLGSDHSGRITLGIENNCSEG
jgi:hypothetical protein